MSCALHNSPVNLLLQEQTLQGSVHIFISFGRRIISVLGHACRTVFQYQGSFKANYSIPRTQDSIQIRMLRTSTIFLEDSEKRDIISLGDRSKIKKRDGSGFKIENVPY